MKTALIVLATSLLIALAPSALAATTPSPTDHFTAGSNAAGGACRGVIGLALCAAREAGCDAYYVLYGEESPGCKQVA